MHSRQKQEVGAQEVNTFATALGDAAHVMTVGAGGTRLPAIVTVKLLTRQGVDHGCIAVTYLLIHGCEQ